MLFASVKQNINVLIPVRIINMKVLTITTSFIIPGNHDDFIFFPRIVTVGPVEDCHSLSNYKVLGEFIISVDIIIQRIMEMEKSLHQGRVLPC